MYLMKVRSESVFLRNCSYMHVCARARACMYARVSVRACVLLFLEYFVTIK